MRMIESQEDLLHPLPLAKQACYWQAADAQSWLRDGPWADLGTGSGALALGLADCLGRSSKAGLTAFTRDVDAAWPSS